MAGTPASPRTIDSQPRPGSARRGAARQAASNRCSRDFRCGRGTIELVERHDVAAVRAGIWPSASTSGRKFPASASAAICGATIQHRLAQRTRAVIAARICWNMARSTMISAGIVRVIASGRPVPTLEFTGAFAAKQHDGLPRTRAGVEVRVRGFRIPRRSTSELESGGVSYLVPTWPGATGSRSPISHVHGRRGGFCPGNSALPDSREANE